MSCYNSEELIELENKVTKLSEQVKELKDFVGMVAAGDSAQNEVKAIMVYTYINRAKSLQDKLNKNN